MLRDDLYKDEAYAKAAYHDEEHGKEVRKTIFKVTVLLTLITIIEVLIGAFVKQYVGGSQVGHWAAVKWLFIGLTLVKAGYIILKFMHLGDEDRDFRYMLLIPYLIFIVYLAAVLLMEGASMGRAVFGS